MICARCDKTIKPGEAYDKRGVETGSGATPDVYLHRWCKQVAVAQPQRTPTGLGS